MITQPARRSPHERARVRAFFANGLDKFRASWAIEALPALVHLSLFIFFTGLVIYLFNVNGTVFVVVASWVTVLLAGYLCITFMPVFWHDSPYYSPLSSTVRLLYTTILLSVLFVSFILTIPFGRKTSRRFARSAGLFLQRHIWSVEGAAKNAASGLSSQIDVGVLNWTIDALGEDDALEGFFECVPGFYKSSVVKDLRQRLPYRVEMKIIDTLVEFLDRTLSSNSVPESVKIRRFTICLDAASEIDTSDGVRYNFDRIIDANWHAMPHSVEIGHFLSSWNKRSNRRFAPYIQGIIARIIATVRERDDRWKALARDQLDIPEGVLQDYLEHGNSVLLANLIQFTRQISHSRWLPINALHSLSEFDIHNTLPGLQHDFCALWNEIVLEALDSPAYDNPTTLLREVRHIYMALHRGTDAAPTAFSDSTPDFAHVLDYASSYPLCNIHVHHLTSHVSAAALITVPHDNSIPVTVAPPSGPDVSFSPSSNPNDITLHPTDQPLLEDITTYSPHARLVPSSNPVTSLDSGIAVTAQDSSDHLTFSSTSKLGDSSILKLAPAPLSGFTTSPRHDADDHMVPVCPPTTSDIPTSSSRSISLSGNTPPADFQPCTTASTSESGSRAECPPRPDALQTPFPSTSRKPPALRPDVASNVATFDAMDDSES